MKVYMAVPQEPKGLLQFTMHLKARAFADLEKAISETMKSMGGEELCCVARMDPVLIWAGCQHPNFFGVPECKIFALELEE